MSTLSQATELNLREHGAQYCPGLALPLLADLGTIAASVPQEKAGTRIAGDPLTASLLAPEGVLGQAVSRLAGHAMGPVRAILFDKSDAANWALAWHRDRTIAVKERRDVPGYERWTVKQGMHHVEPPFAVTSRMLTVRVYLDAVDEANAPLLIALASHGRGFIPVNAVESVVSQSNTFACLAEVGDVWVYATSILHASGAAAPGNRRRVLQVDFSPDALPQGLDWLGI